MKKIITLLLALVMLVSVMALPALAATAEPHTCAEIQRHPMSPCIYCGSYNTVFMGYISENMARYYCNACNRYFNN